MEKITKRQKWLIKLLCEFTLQDFPNNFNNMTHRQANQYIKKLRKTDRKRWIRYKKAKGEKLWVK